MFIKTTRNIKITVFPTYLPDQSDTISGIYVWAYFIRIENMGQETVQLMNRHWHITDANGNVQEVRGPGVVGEQPMIEPGDMHQYASGVPLPTPSGIMQGDYEMQTETGELFLVDIPAFSLDSPEQLQKPH